MEQPRCGQALRQRTPIWCFDALERPENMRLGTRAWLVEWTFQNKHRELFVIGLDHDTFTCLFVTMVLGQACQEGVTPGTYLPELAQYLVRV